MHLLQVKRAYQTVRIWKVQHKLLQDLRNMLDHMQRLYHYGRHEHVNELLERTSPQL